MKIYLTIGLRGMWSYIFSGLCPAYVYGMREGLGRSETDLSWRQLKRSSYATLMLYGVAIMSGCMSAISIDLETRFDPQKGPRVTYDLYARPFSLVPFPNDIALKVSHETLSGVSWNAPLIKPTDHENQLRADFNQLDGFGPFAPILVTFDGPLDLDKINADHVVIVNVEPGHPRYGEQVPLDLGQGFFPGATEAHAYFEYDPFKETTSLVLPESNEVDGAWITHYDVASNTLIARPIMPLAQGARHAVLLNVGLTGLGEAGARGSIQSPFPAKAHLAQLDWVQEAVDVVGWSEAELAFGWTYTTSDVIRPMTLIREGLYGRGRFAPYQDGVPARILEIRDTSIERDGTPEDQDPDPRDHRFILQAEFLSEVFEAISQISDNQNLALSFEHVDYFVFGQFESPQIRDPDTGKVDINWLNPVFKEDAGEIFKRESVPFMVSIPKTTETRTPPFPVMFYFHGTGTSRFEATAIADRMAQQGIAVFSIDQVGHGPLIPDIGTLLEESNLPPSLISTVALLLSRILAPDRQNEFIGLEPIEAFNKLEEIGLFAEFTVHGRAYDEDQNGREEIAEGFFHANPFKMCGSFLQDLVDFMQAIRLLRSLGVPEGLSAGLSEPQRASYDQLKPHLLSGDFNADGRLDLGGPAVAFSAAGTSLGGIHSVMAAAIEPEVKSVSPIVAGGGLANLISRSTLHFLLEDVFKETFGALLIGCPVDDQVYLLLGSKGARCDERSLARAVAQVDRLHPESIVVISTPDHDEVTTVTLNEGGGFYAQIPVDQGALIQVTITSPDREEPLLLEVTAEVDGSGYARNSSDLLRAFILEQHALGRCDPINFARHLFWEPLEGHDPTSVLFLNAVGDATVPISDGILLGLASGIFGREEAEWRPLMMDLIDRGVFRGDQVDVHGILRGTEWARESQLEPYGLFTPVRSGDGMSSMHIADVNGKHEWVAGYTTPSGFEYGMYSQNQISVFHGCGGRVIMSQPVDCLSHATCESVSQAHEHPECEHVAIKP